MSRTVTALYTTREEADRALQSLCAELSLAHAEVYDHTSERRAALQQLDLTPEERASCERNMASGEYMLLAQVHTGEDPDHIIAILERVAAGETADRPVRSDFGGGNDREDDAAQGGELLLGGGEQGSTVAEERIPIVEEELRVGTREVVRGGARVRTRVEEIPVQQEVELVEEHASVERRLATRTISEAELEAGGLLRERVIEIAQIREEAVVTKEAFVREEVVVSKSVDRRVEQIHETVRRTEVETDELGADAPRPAFTGLDDARSDFPR